MNLKKLVLVFLFISFALSTVVVQPLFSMENNSSSNDSSSKLGTGAALLGISYVIYSWLNQGSTVESQNSGNEEKKQNLTPDDDENKKSVCFSDEIEEFFIEDIDSVVGFNQILNDLDEFINLICTSIINKINRENRSLPELTSNFEGIEFVDLEGFTSKNLAEDRLPKMIESLKEQSTVIEKIKSKDTLEKIKSLIQKLDITRESLFNAQLLAQDDEQILFETIDKSMNHLEKFGIKPTRAYEMLGLSSVCRSIYTVDYILTICDFAEKYLDSESQHAKQVRQIKFTLGNEIAKKIYDAWLSDKEKGVIITGHLSMLRIAKEDIEKFKLDFDDLMNALLQCKVQLEIYKKELEKKE
jgi:hypothetical protein